MRHRIVCPFGVYDFVFRNEMEPGEVSVPFSDATEAMIFLRRFMGDGGNMAAFRAVLGRDQSLHGAAAWETDAEVARQLCWRLVQRRFFLVKAVWEQRPSAKVEVNFT